MLQTHPCLKATYSDLTTCKKSWLLILSWYQVESTESVGIHVIFVMCCCCLLFHLYWWGTINRATHPAACEWQQWMFHRNADFWDRPIFPSQPNKHCPPGDSLEEKWRWKIRARGTERGKAEDDSGGESNPSIDCVCPHSPCEWEPSRGYTEMLKRWDTTREEAVTAWKVGWDQMTEMRTRRVSPPSYACKSGHWLCKEPRLTKQKDRQRAAGPDPSLCCSRFPCLPPPGTAGHKAGSKGAAAPLNKPAALNPLWVGHKPEITSLLPKAWKRFGQILRAQHLTVYLAAGKRKNRLCPGKHFSIKWECSWSELFTGSPVEFQIFFTLWWKLEKPLNSNSQKHPRKYLEAV